MLFSIFTKLKEVFRILRGTQKSVEQALHIKPTISNEMICAIELWSNMYRDRAPWIKHPTEEDPERITSLGLPAFIASEKARMATLEMKSEITAQLETVEDVDEITGLAVETQQPVGDTSRADFLNEQYKNTILKDIRIQLEYGIAKGGLIIKPYAIINDDGSGMIAVDYIQADGFYPIAFDASGKMTEAAFVQRIVNKDNIYSRLEYHKLSGNTVTVVNKAFKIPNINGSGSNEDLGKEISLTDVTEWANLEPETTINDVDRLLFAYFKMPLANTVDTYSPLGVSGYSRAVKLIRDADEQYSRLLWEFEGSELAIDIDRTALRTDIDENGRDITKLPRKQQRLFRKVDLNNEETYHEFSPAIRDVSLLNGLNSILMRIEDTCELARGTLSDVNAEARTATEISVLKQRSYASNAQIQTALEHALRDVVYIMNVYTTLYRLAPEGNYDISFEWDDSIQTDRESEMAKRMSLLQSGIISKIEYRMWYFGETEEQAIQALEKIQQYNTYEMQSGLSIQESEV